MENVRKASIDQATVVDTWLTRWSQFIQQSPLSKTGFTEARSEVIQQVLEAMLRGESCISVAAEAVTVLDDLVMDEQQAQQQKSAVCLRSAAIISVSLLGFRAVLGPASSTVKTAKFNASGYFSLCSFA